MNRSLHNDQCARFEHYSHCQADKLLSIINSDSLDYRNGLSAQITHYARLVNYSVCANVEIQIAGSIYNRALIEVRIHFAQV